MKKVEKFKRVTATNPGKYGFKDWKVEVGDIAPTHGEMVFALGMILLAEQRYDDGRDGLGTGMLAIFLERILKNPVPEEIRKQAERAERT